MEPEETTIVRSEKDPARILPYTGYIPYVPKASLTQAEKDQMFRERNFTSFKKADHV